jgi:hypothetical protein
LVQHLASRNKLLSSEQIERRQMDKPAETGLSETSPSDQLAPAIFAQTPQHRYGALTEIIAQRRNSKFVLRFSS